MPRRLLKLVAWTVGVLVAGNLAIFGAFLAGRLLEPENRLAVEGIDNVRVVDDKLWRGEAPSAEGYRALADRGVSTIIDLRAERNLNIPEGLLEDLAIDRIHLPMRDGQTPAPANAERFVELVRQADGLVFVHCGAGVGRAGVMAATYLVREGGTSSWAALGRNLAVGPPSLEQMVYAASLDAEGNIEQPPGWVEAISRVFDGPRRIWSALRA